MKVWLDGAQRIKAWQDGGSLLGGPRRVVWHSTENDPTKTTAATIAHYLNRVGYQCHLVWNPVTGEIIQMIPADRAGRALGNAPGGIETNRGGSLCVQIEVVGRAARPFTSSEMKGRSAIIEWLRGLGIPDVWPGGPPPAAPGTRHVSAATWKNSSGHFSHSQVPENDHNDPGAIDIRRLFGEDDMPLDGKDVEKIFQTDGILDNPVPDKDNPKVRAGWLFVDTNQRLRKLEAQVAAIAKKVGA